MSNRIELEIHDNTIHEITFYESNRQAVDEYMQQIARAHSRGVCLFID